MNIMWAESKKEIYKILIKIHKDHVKIKSDIFKWLKNFSVYLSTGMSPSWIVGKISEDIRNELVHRGIKCNYGPPNYYNGEDVCHMGWAYAKPKDSAKLNSVFLTILTIS